MLVEGRGAVIKVRHPAGVQRVLLRRNRWLRSKTRLRTGYFPNTPPGCERETQKHTRAFGREGEERRKNGWECSNAHGGDVGMSLSENCEDSMGVKGRGNFFKG